MVLGAVCLGGAPSRLPKSATHHRWLITIEPDVDTRLEAGDVAVLLGVPAAVATAEERLLRGH